MSNTMKGILFSAFIFPGTGQIILAKYMRGAVYFAIAFVSGILCVTAIVRQAMVVLQAFVERGEVVTIPKAMVVVAEASTYSSSLFFRLSFLVFFCCWLVSILDAWKTGRQLDADGLSMTENT